MKSDIFNTELNFIKDKNIRESTKQLLELLPDYFYEIPASTTGKYHPSYALGNQGLVRHTKVVAAMAHILSENNCIGHVFTAEEKDLMITACLLHDGLKTGREHSKYTLHEHPIIAAEFVMENYKGTSLTEEQAKFIASAISTHMGEWNTNKYSDVVLPIPSNKYQRFVHMADFLASRKFIEVPFENNEIIFQGED